MFEVETVQTPVETVAARVHQMAVKYKVSEDEMYKTLWCESNFQNGQSQYKDPSGPNGQEDSWGVAQIHLPDHPTISRAEAEDSAFAVEWMAKEFKAGRQWQWSCYKLIK